MKIHEYQAKNILREYGVPVPTGELAKNPEEAKRIAERHGKKDRMKESARPRWIHGAAGSGVVARCCFRCSGWTIRRRSGRTRSHDQITPESAKNIVNLPSVAKPSLVTAV